MNDTSTASEDFPAALHGSIAAARESELSDEATIAVLAEAIEALREGLS